MGYAVTTKQSCWRLYFTRDKSAILVVNMGETAEQLWRRHFKKHPEDQFADVKIFHLISKKHLNFSPWLKRICPRNGMNNEKIHTG
jgi:hypothetical protein